MSDLTYKVLNTDGTITVYDKAAEIDSQLTAIKNYIDTPVATYTHTANKSVAVSALDIDTNTFTAVAHGYANDNVVYLVINDIIDGEYPYNYRATLAYSTPYYVVNKTDDTFQVSASSGGAAVDIAAGGDITKWHFESYSGTVVIAGLPTCKKYRMIIRGRLLKDAQLYINLNEMTTDAKWIREGTGDYTYFYFIFPAHMYFKDIIDIDFSEELSVQHNYVRICSAAAATNSLVTGSLFGKSPFYANTDITKISMEHNYFANGTTIEVYKI